MALSDWTGEQIEPDAEAKVICTLPDGKRRELTVRAAEASDLAAKGTNVTRVGDRVWAWGRHNWRKPALWALGILVTSLALPAITKQWSDRQQSVNLKSALFTDLSTGSVRAYNSATEIAKGTPQDPAKALIKAKDAWIVSEGSLDARYVVYFGNTAADAAWLRYREAVFSLVDIACCNRERRGDELNMLHKYLGDPAPPAGVRRPWQVLRCGPQEGCRSPASYADAYRWLALAVLRRRDAVLDGLTRTRPAGFSSGWRDFLHDTFAPFGA